MSLNRVYNYCRLAKTKLMLYVRYFRLTSQQPLETFLTSWIPWLPQLRILPILLLVQSKWSIYFSRMFCGIKGVFLYRYQAYSTMAVTDSQVKEFEDRWKVKVIRIDTNKSSSRPEIFDCSYQMNRICKALWNRDQEFISKQIIQV